MCGEIATISTRPKSPSRTEAIAKSLVNRPIFSNGVLIGNWVEDRIECPKSGTFYFPPKDEIDCVRMKPESRQPDFRQNKLISLQGHVCSVTRQDSHDSCPNYATTTDLVYNHLPRALCGPIQRYYKRCAHQFYPQPDLMKCFYGDSEAPVAYMMANGYCNPWISTKHLKQICFDHTVDATLSAPRHQPEHSGNVTEWGLRRQMQYEWKCTDVSDYISTLYEDTFVPPMPHQYLQRSERRARSTSFTKSFRFKMTKSKPSKR